TEPRQVSAIVAVGAIALGRAIEGAEDHPDDGERQVRRRRVGRRDLVVAVSASGTTPFVVGALARARADGALTALLCCADVAPSIADLVVRLDAGPELIAGATRSKSGTALRIALDLLSTSAMVRLGRVREGRLVGLRARNDKQRATAVETVTTLAGVGVTRATRLLREAGWDVSRALAAATRRGPASRR
ncbi:MAG: N-acetylmuramic acid 6-phosphate etherase, partial [Myxococcales bacterium]